MEFMEFAFPSLLQGSPAGTNSPCDNSISLSNPPRRRLTTLHHCMEETFPSREALKSKEDINYYSVFHTTALAHSTARVVWLLVIHKSSSNWPGDQICKFPCLLWGRFFSADFCFIIPLEKTQLVCLVEIGPQIINKKWEGPHSIT